MRINGRHARRVAVTAAVAAVSLVGASAAPAQPAAGVEKIEDTETVYAVMDATGGLKSTIVVDWLHVEGDGTVSIVDPAPEADAIESLTDGFEPNLSGDDVVAEVTVDGRGDFFYRAETQKDLPIDVKVTYTLDGDVVDPAELAGKSGRLKIDISIHNKLEREDTVSYEDADGVTRSTEVTYTVPMMCAPQVVLDGRRMYDIVPPEGAQVMVTGSNRTVVVPMMPSPDATATIEMQAEDIEIDPIMITALPMLPATPDLSSADQLAELNGGIKQLRQLSEGHVKVLEGVAAGIGSADMSEATKAAEGLKQLQGGLAKMASGTDGLAKLSQAQVAYLDGLISNIDASQFESVTQLQGALSQLRSGVGGVRAGAETLVQILDAQIALLDQIRSSNSELVALAQDRAAAYSADSTSQAIAIGLEGQQAMLDILRDGGEVGGQAVPGLVTTRGTLDELARGLAQTEAGLQALEEQTGALSAVPQAFGQLKGALVVLRDGGQLQGQQFPGLKTTASGLGGVADGLNQVSTGLSGSAASFEQLSSLPKMMSELVSTLDAVAHGGKLKGQTLPGITTTVQALTEISNGLGTGVNEMREGQELVDAMKAAADSYTSFLGLPEGAEGEVSFMLKLDGISKK